MKIKEVNIILRRFFREIKYKIIGFKCEDCANYNIGDGVDDESQCYNCKNYKE